jgi:hypothetical protein
MRAAINEVKDRREVSIRSIAVKYGIPPTTLYGHINQTATSIGAGKPSVLTHDEEQEIIYCCQVLQELGFAITKDSVTSIVCQYLSDTQRPNPFVNSVPGKKWWSLFLKRWPTLVQRKPQHLPKQRALAGNPTAVQEYFSKVQALLERLDIVDVDDLAKRLWNCDESGISTAVASNAVLARRGSRWVHETGGGSGREMITILGCGSAAGDRLPPYILYKGKHLYSTWTFNGPVGAVYSCSESGWMERSNFESWFSKSFLPAVDSIVKDGPIVLFLDGHHSHLGIDFIELARSHNVHPFCLPAHTSHFLQPLDVGVYGPMKKTWKGVLKEYKTATRASNVTKQVFPSLVKKLWERSLQASHLQAGFRECGLWPFNPSAIPVYKMAPSLALNSTSETSLPVTATETPLRTELRSFFVQHLKPKEVGPQMKRQRAIHATGDALTNEDVIASLRTNNPGPSRKRKATANTTGSKRSRPQKAKGQLTSKTPSRALDKDDSGPSRKRKATADITGSKQSRPQKATVPLAPKTPPHALDNDDSEKDCDHCFSCGKQYHDGQEKIWVGCDTCYRWYHIQCAGFKSIPKGDFVCHIYKGRCCQVQA